VGHETDYWIHDGLLTSGKVDGKVISKDTVIQINSVATDIGGAVTGLAMGQNSNLVVSYQVYEKPLVSSGPGKAVGVNNDLGEVRGSLTMSLGLRKEGDVYTTSAVVKSTRDGMDVGLLVDINKEVKYHYSWKEERRFMIPHL
jgi:hypothetical protein